MVVATWSVDRSKGGIKTYLTNVVAALLRQPGVEVVLLHDRRNADVFGPFGEAPGCTLVPMELPGPVAARPVAEQVVAHRIDPRLGDVLLVPSNVGLLRARLPQVVVVQAPLAVPTIRRRHRALVASSIAHRVYHRATLGPALRRADAVVAVTDWLRRELLASIPRLDPARVVAVPEGVVVPEGAAGAPGPAPGAPPTVLFVSTLFPYKGARELVDALAHLGRERPDLDWRARIVGPDPTGGRTAAALREQARAAGPEVGARVEVAGPVPHEQVWQEYAAASVFVYPSRLETFGLPPLEAMAMGTPVVASDAPAVAEVVGDAALVVDPTDPAALAGAIATLLDDRAARAELVERGRRHAAAMTWDAAAASLVEVLRAAAVR